MARGSEEAAVPNTQVDREVLTAIAICELNVSAQHHAQPFNKCRNA